MCKDKVDILKITDGKKWHDLAVKKMSTLLRGITTNHDDDYCCIKCRYLIRTDYDKRRKKWYCKQKFCRESEDKFENLRMIIIMIKVTRAFEITVIMQVIIDFIDITLKILKRNPCSIT